MGRRRHPPRADPPGLRHGRAQPVSLPAPLAQQGARRLPLGGLHGILARDRGGRGQRRHRPVPDGAGRPVPDKRGRFHARLRRERLGDRFLRPDLWQGPPGCPDPFLRGGADRRRGLLGGHRGRRARLRGRLAGLAGRRCSTRYGPQPAPAGPVPPGWDVANVSPAPDSAASSPPASGSRASASPVPGSSAAPGTGGTHGLILLGIAAAGLAVGGTLGYLRRRRMQRAAPSRGQEPPGWSAP